MLMRKNMIKVKILIYLWYKIELNRSNDHLLDLFFDILTSLVKLLMEYVH